MTFHSQRDQVLHEIEAAVRASQDDVLRDAQKRAGSKQLASSGKVDRIGPTKARIVFDAPFAKARERGAYIVPHRRKALRFANGDFSMHARLRKHPYLVPAARRWGTRLLARLREAAAE